MDGFTGVEESAEKIDSDRTVQFGKEHPIISPGVICIGYIPYFARIPRETDYHRFNLWQRYGFWLLFRTGNREPPNALCTKLLSSSQCACQEDTLGKFFEINPPERPEFRTVCWLRDVTLKPKPDGRATLSFFRGYRVGKTASPSPPDSVGRLYFKGDGEDFYEGPTWSSESVTFTYKHTFKLGRLSDSVAAMFMGAFAPSALIQIKYTLYTDGSYKMSLSGSTLPNQSFYINCRRQRHWDMSTVLEDGIRSFIYAGRCQTAPSRQGEIYP